MRSKCPLNYGIELFGDKWSLLIIRDLTFASKRYYGEFLQSDEGISTNILANRLNSLEEIGIISKRNDDTHKQKLIYSLTEKGIDLLPILIEIGMWSDSHANDEELDETRDIILDMFKKDREEALKFFRKKLLEEHINGKI